MYSVIKDKAYLDRNSIPEPNSGCWIWLGASSKRGYGIIGSKPHNLGAHRLSYELYVGPIPQGQMVLHKCDMPSCVNPDHLFVGTQTDNIRDMHKKGRGRAKLRPEQVAEIQSLPKYYGLGTDLVNKYGMQREHLLKIHKKGHWKFLTQPKGPE